MAGDFPAEEEDTSTSLFFKDKAGFKTGPEVQAPLTGGFCFQKERENGGAPQVPAKLGGVMFVGAASAGRSGGGPIQWS